jgi:acyl-CoA dehydrogenase
VAWDFETDEEFQKQLDWANEFVRNEVEPLDLLMADLLYHPLDGERKAIVDPLKQAVRDQGMWAAHLSPELGGQGHGQLKLALLNEILGRSLWAPIIFGTQSPDTGNAEIIAHYGTDDQKKCYLEPLLNGDIFSCYSMTEPQGGSDPTMFETRAVRNGDSWVINGWKYFSSNARTASFLIVMAVTDPDESPYNGMSMFLVPTDTPGVEIVRNVGLMGERSGKGMHALIHYSDCRVPVDNLLGDAGKAFAMAQTRLGGGRIHHAMRTVAVCQRAIDMMGERVVSRRTQGSLLSEKQLTQAAIADSWIELQQFRLLVLQTAWKIDKYKDYRRVRGDIAAVKVQTPRVQQSIVWRAMHLHGALGVSNEMPFGSMWNSVAHLAAADGPTEVHQVTLAKQLLRGYSPSPDEWPSEHLPRKRAAAEAKYAALVEREVGNL